MKRSIILESLAMVTALMMATAPYALAHEHQIFKIDGKFYQFTVGSLNEPVAVDDKTGVELKVELVTEEHAMEKHEEEAGAHTEETFPPVTGLEKTLKVELGAGEKTKVLDLTPIYNTPGSYRANFTPTIETTYDYRFFGTINNTPVSLTFSCNPAGHPQTAASMQIEKLSDAVERVSKVGAYGCPAAKADLGFPEKSASLYDLDSKTQALENSLAQTKTSSRVLSISALVAGILGLIVAIYSSRKKTI